MRQLLRVWLYLSPFFFLSSGCAYTSISTRQHHVVFRYSDDHKSEKDLPLCAENSVCSILHKRYWLHPIAERICRCPSAEECPWKWQNSPDDQTMILNNRAQFKFCSSVTAQRTCSSKATALTTEKTTLPTMKTSLDISVYCFCPLNYQWRHTKTSKTISKQNSSQIIHEMYKCLPLRKCSTFDFCGNVRSDFNSIYYTCSCPLGHYCMYRDKTTRNVDELMYKGPAFKAFCEPYDDEAFDY